MESENGCDKQFVDSRWDLYSVKEDKTKVSSKELSTKRVNEIIFASDAFEIDGTLQCTG